MLASLVNLQQGAVRIISFDTNASAIAENVHFQWCWICKDHFTYTIYVTTNDKKNDTSSDYLVYFSLYLYIVLSLQKTLYGHVLLYKRKTNWGQTNDITFLHIHLLVTTGVVMFTSVVESEEWFIIMSDWEVKSVIWG